MPQKIFRLKGSTTYDAQTTADLNQSKLAVTKKIAQTLLDEKGLESFELNAEQEQKLREHLNEIKISSDGIYQRYLWLG